MAGIVESVLINISAAVSGAAGIAGLTGGIGALSGKLLGLNAGLQIVQQVTGAISGMVATMGDYAAKADGAAVSARSWQVVLERFNVDAKSAGEAISDLSQRTGASEMSLKSAAAQYIKMGGTLEDFSKVALAASSSWYDLTVKSISLDDAINNVSTGVASGRSELLESSGVMLNASQAYKRYSDEIGKSVDEMSDAEKAHAYAIGVFKEEQIGIETLTEKQTELSRAKNLDTQATQRLGEAIGRNLLPYQVKLTETGAEVKRTLTQMFDTYQEGGDVLKVLTDRYPQLGKVLSQLKPVAEDMRRSLLEAWGGIADYAERVLYPIFEGIRPVAERVWKYIPPLIQSAGRLIGETFHLLADLWVNVLKPAWDAFGPVVEYAITKSVEALQDGLDFVSGTFAAIRALIGGDWRGAWDTFSETVNNAWEKVNTILSGLGTAIREALFKLAETAKERGRIFGENLRDSIVAGVSGLAEQLTDKMTEAIEKMTAKLPQWFKDRFGITAVVETLEGNADAAGARAAAARAGIAGRAPEIDPKTLNDFQKFILSASETGRGLEGKFNDKADSLVDYCARWVRDTLGDAAPEMRMAINALFLNNPERINGDLTPTARSAYGNFQKAGLTRDYKTFADLKPGDTVFYTDGGQNHTGVYIGNGMVRGNNRVTYQENGGRFGPGGINSGRALDNGKVDPVGDVNINRLGKVTGYVAAQELLAYLTGRVPVTGTPKAGTPANTVTPPPAPPPADTTDKGGPFTAAQYAQAQKLLATIESAKKALQADPKNAGLANALTAAEKASADFGKSTLAAGDALKAAQASITSSTKKSSDSYIASRADFVKYGKEALLLIKEQERITESGTAAEREAMRGKVEAFTKDSKARAAVLDAERAAYQSRQQAAAEANRAGEESSALAGRIAEETAAEAKRRGEEARQQAARVNQAIRDNNVQAAGVELARLEGLRTDARKSAEGNAAQLYVVERRYADLIYSAKKAVLDKEKIDRDAAITMSGLPQKVKTGQFATSGVMYTNALSEARRTRDAALSEADDALSMAAVKWNANLAKGLADGLIAGLQNQKADEALDQKAVAWNATLAKSITDGLVQGIRDKRADEALSEKAAEWNAALSVKLGQNLVKELTERQRVELGIQATGNEAIASAAQQAAAELAKGEQWGEALDVLGGALERVMNSALEGEDAGNSVNTLTQAINDLTDARAKAIAVARQEQAMNLALTKPLEANPDRNPGSIRDKFALPLTGTSEARRTRPNERLNADGTPYVDPGTGARDEGAADRARAWEVAMRSERVDAYRDSLKLLDLQQLDTAKSAAILALDTERYGYILTEIESKKGDQAALAEIRQQAEAMAALDEQLAPVAVNLQSVFGRLENGVETSDTARASLAQLRAQLESIGGPAAQNLIAAIDETVDGFDTLGSASKEAEAGLAKLRKETELPYTALIEKLQAMRDKPGAAVVQIDNLILALQKLNGVSAKAQGIEKMTAKINEFADYARKSIPLVTSAFQALGGASDEVAGAWGDSLGRMIDDVVNFATAIAKGDYIGAAIQALTSIFTFFARQAQEARAEMKKTLDYNKGFKFDANGYGTRKTTSTTTGFLFWKKTVVTEQIDEMGKAMALSFENAVVDGVSGGLAEAVAKGDSSILEKSILTSLKTAALKGLTEAFLSSASVVAVIGPLIQKLIAAFKSGNTENIRAAVGEFRDGVKSLKGEMDGLVEAGKIVSEELGGAGESFASSFGDSIRSGVRAILSGQSPLQALYDDVRSRIENAVINGFFVQRALDRLQPFLDALDAKLKAGMDPTQAIAQLGQQLPGISAQLQLELGPLVAALNTYLPNALNANTAALNGNTAALRESNFEISTVVSYADVGRPSNVRQQLAGL